MSKHKSKKKPKKKNINETTYSSFEAATDASYMGAPFHTSVIWGSLMFLLGGIINTFREIRKKKKNH